MRHVQFCLLLLKRTKQHRHLCWVFVFCLANIFVYAHKAIWYSMEVIERWEKKNYCSKSIKWRKKSVVKRLFGSNDCNISAHSFAVHHQIHFTLITHTHYKYTNTQFLRRIASDFYMHIKSVFIAHIKSAPILNVEKSLPC